MRKVCEIKQRINEIDNFISKIDSIKGTSELVKSMLYSQYFAVKRELEWVLNEPTITL